MTSQERIDRLGRVLCFTPGSAGFDLKQDIGGRRCWWLVGGVEGDQALPGTCGMNTLAEALDAAEAWFAPEVDEFENASARARTR